MDTEKRIVKASNDAQMDYYNQEKIQKLVRKKQMADNINQSMRMRQEQDNELANKVLQNEVRINKLNRIT